MNVPEWVINMVHKCLAKKPGLRFANGIELHDYIALNSSLAARKGGDGAAPAAGTNEHTERLLREKEQLQKQLAEYHQQAEIKDRELRELTSIVLQKDQQLQKLKTDAGSLDQNNSTGRKGVSKAAFITILILAIGFAAYAAYTFYHQNIRRQRIASVPTEDTTSRKQAANSIEPKKEKIVKKKSEPDSIEQVPKAIFLPPDTETSKADSIQSGHTVEEHRQNGIRKGTAGAKYKVISKAFFYDQPDEATQRKAYIVHWNDAVLTALDDSGDFIYVVYTNNLGQTSKGWLRKSDLNRVDQ